MKSKTNTPSKTNALTHDLILLRSIIQVIPSIITLIFLLGSFFVEIYWSFKSSVWIEMTIPLVQPEILISFAMISFIYNIAIVTLISLRVICYHILHKKYRGFRSSWIFEVFNQIVVTMLAMFLYPIEYFVLQLKLVFIVYWTITPHVKNSLNKYSQHGYLKYTLSLYADYVLIQMFSLYKLWNMRETSLKSDNLFAKLSDSVELALSISMTARGWLIGVRALMHKNNNKSAALTIEIILLLFNISLFVMHVRLKTFHLMITNILFAAFLASTVILNFSMIIMSQRSALSVYLLTFPIMLHMLQAYYNKLPFNSKHLIREIVRGGRDLGENSGLLAQYIYVVTSTKSEKMKKLFNQKKVDYIQGQKPKVTIDTNLNSPDLKPRYKFSKVFKSLGTFKESKEYRNIPQIPSTDDLANVSEFSFEDKEEEAQFLWEIILLIFEELEYKSTLKPHIAFMKIECLLHFYPSLSLTVGILNKMMKACRTTQQLILLRDAKHQCETYYRFLYKMNYKMKIIRESSNMQAEEECEEFVRIHINSTTSGKKKNIAFIPHPVTVDLAYAFYYKNQLQSLVDSIQGFTHKKTEFLHYISSHQCDINTLFGFVKKLYNKKIRIQDMFKDFDSDTNRLHYSHMIPFIHHLNSNINSHQSALQYLELYKKKNNLQLLNREVKELRINNFNLFVDCFYLLIETGSKTFGQVLDVYGNYHLFIDSHSEAIGHHFDQFLTAPSKIMHLEVGNDVYEGNLDKYQVIGTSQYGFIKLPGTLFSVYSNVVPKIVPYAEMNFKMIVAVKPLFELHHDQYFIVINEKYEIECYSYNFLEVVPITFICQGVSLKSVSAILYSKIEEIEKAKKREFIRETTPRNLKDKREAALSLEQPQHSFSNLENSSIGSEQGPNKIDDEFVMEAEFIFSDPLGNKKRRRFFVTACYKEYGISQGGYWYFVLKDTEQQIPQKFIVEENLSLSDEDIQNTLPEEKDALIEVQPATFKFQEDNEGISAATEELNEKATLKDLKEAGPKIFETQPSRFSLDRFPPPSPNIAKESKHRGSDVSRVNPSFNSSNFPDSHEVPSIHKTLKEHLQKKLTQEGFNQGSSSQFSKFQPVTTPLMLPISQDQKTSRSSSPENTPAQSRRTRKEAIIIDTKKKKTLTHQIQQIKMNVEASRADASIRDDSAASKNDIDTRRMEIKSKTGTLKYIKSSSINKEYVRYERALKNRVNSKLLIVINMVFWALIILGIVVSILRKQNVTKQSKYHESIVSYISDYTSYRLNMILAFKSILYSVALSNSSFTDYR